MQHEDFLPRAQSFRNDLVRLRHKLHRHPELSHHESATAMVVKNELEQLGLNPVTGLAGTHGVMATLDSGRDGPTLLLRCDMDALPISEETGADYASEVPGVMHACGHDAHMTCCLGAARLLTAMKDELRGRVRFLFQPAEEVPPGGAKKLIEHGAVLDGVDAAVALHVHPQIPVGVVGLRDGEMLSFTDRFRISITGSGGHGGRPHQAVDAISVAVQVYQALQYLVSRENDPMEPLVLTIGRFAGGSAPNVIAGEVEMEGTVRCLNADLAREMPRKMERVIAGVCASARADFEFQQEPGYPVLINDPTITRKAMASARALLGDDAVRWLERPELGGEDFAYFAQVLPSLFFRLGVGNVDQGIVHPMHHPKFDLDEDALPIGAAVLAKIAMDFVNGEAIES